MPMSIQFSASALGTRNGGQGGGQYIQLANAFSPAFGAAASQRTLLRPAVSTADYYHVDGVYWARPYDLNAMGTRGQGIATAKGMRYVWLIASDHPAITQSTAFPTQNSWGRDPESIYAGYSNDPGVLPDPSTLKPIIPADGIIITGSGGTEVYNSFQYPWLVYNVDADRFHVYTEGADATGGALVNSLNTIVWTGNDFDTAFTIGGVSHACTGPFGFTATQTVYRTGVNTWVSYGGGNTTGNDGSIAKWTSTDGLTFTKGSVVTATLSGRSFGMIGSPIFTISGQDYSVVREDARSADGGMYVTQVPIDANGNLITTGTPPITRLSSKYNGVYPGPTYLQQVSGYYEDGVGHWWALHGFFADEGLVNGAPYSQGGGLDEEYLDYYAVVHDATAAANAAPLGVSASCASGTATISWYDILPNHTYRVYRGTTAGTQATLIGDVTNGASITNAPAGGSVYYYKVVTLNGASEVASRIVSTYVSSSSAFVNKHITRILAAGADVTTIDRTWLDSVDTWLTANSLQQNLLCWVDAAFGVTKSGSTISKIFDLGTTRLPRGGDYTPSTANTSYGATSLNSAVPGWTNANAASFGYFGSGRLNQIRRKTSITVVAAYQHANANLKTLLAIGEFRGFALQHTAGTPGTASFKFSDSSAYTTVTQALTGSTVNIIGGTFDGTTVKPYVEGVAGTGSTGPVNNYVLLGQVGNSGSSFVLTAGTENAKFQHTTRSTAGSYVFENNQAQFVGGALIVFDTDIGVTLMASLNTLLRTRIGA